MSTRIVLNLWIESGSRPDTLPANGDTQLLYCSARETGTGTETETETETEIIRIKVEETETETDHSYRPIALSRRASLVHRIG